MGLRIPDYKGYMSIETQEVSMRLRSIVLAAAAIAIIAPAARATVIFDEYVPGVSWNVDWGSLNTTSASSGTQSIQANPGNSQIVFIPPTSTPLTIGTETMLEFDINTATAAPVSILLRVSTPTKVVEYDWNNTPPAFEIDGIPATGPVVTDADTSTWQHVKFDITQPYDFWGVSGPEFTSLTAVDQISKFEFRDGATTLVDNVQVVAVPEPTMLGLLSLSGLLALRRRD